MTVSIFAGSQDPNQYRKHEGPTLSSGLFSPSSCHAGGTGWRRRVEEMGEDWKEGWVDAAPWPPMLVPRVRLPACAWLCLMAQPGRLLHPMRIVLRRRALDTQNVFWIETVTHTGQRDASQRWCTPGEEKAAERTALPSFSLSLSLTLSLSVSLCFLRVTGKERNAKS